MGLKLVIRYVLGHFRVGARRGKVRRCRPGSFAGRGCVPPARRRKFAAGFPEHALNTSPRPSFGFCWQASRKLPFLLDDVREQLAGGNVGTDEFEILFHHRQIVFLFAFGVGEKGIDAGFQVKSHGVRQQLAAAIPDFRIGALDPFQEGRLGQGAPQLSKLARRRCPGP